MYNYFHKNPSFVTEYFSRQDWDQLVTNTEDVFPEEKTTELRAAIFSKVKRKRTIGVVLIKASVAAVLVLAVGLFGWKVFSAKPSLSRIAIKGARIGNMEIRYNISAMPERLQLPDNSTVLLSPNSKIQYLTGFRKERRVVFLEGTAIFQVTKDAKRPFTVKSYGIATTALGTRFKVVATKGSSSRSVTLYEGKVVVRADNHKDKRYYLLPGYSLTYNKLTDDFKVNEFLPKKVQGGITPSAVTLEDHTADDKTFKRSLKEDIRFENAPLEEVLHYLSARFNKKINFDKSVIKNINFVGTIHQQDSLTSILEDIALINHLHVEYKKTDSATYLIK